MYAILRCIHEVTECIDNHLAPEHIIFPNTRRELNINKELFMQHFNFPGVVGAIDGTHVAILKPVIEEHNFVNRKGFHSLNVQIICNSNLRILNINANYPGATHDSFIWRQSQIREYMNHLHNEGNRGCWLIGDSGYPLEPYLMTPFLNPAENSPEARYNQTHCSARNCVERCIGVLKMRFRCILKERTARYTPQLVGRLVNTCATLHNMCIDHGIPFANEVDRPEPLHNNNNYICT
ncbi:putative nuclease HARBI1 [Photinus pyralis]|uniref:putative nuclease HARBI1 n=1 Tax=Photinus pyralis TaxID=7054 RepID=UPI001266E8C8|nr:putative nuclease HARBI1 [Photinus pyralis]